MRWFTGERVALGLLLVLLVATPLFLGSVPGFDVANPEPGPWLGFFQALGPWYLFLTLGALMAGVLLHEGRWPEREARTPLLLLAGLGLLVLFQCVPLPRFIGALLAPAATAHREALGIDGWAPVSWEVGLTLREAARFGSHLAIVAAVAVLVRSRRARWILAGAVVTVGALDALYGLAEHFLLGDRVLGFEKLTGMGKVTGTFINKNHLAALMEIAIPLAVAILIHRRRASGARRSGAVDVLLLVAVLAMVAAAVMTLSRAAYGALFGGLLVLLFLLLFRRDAGKAAVATVVIFIVLLVVVPLVIVEAFEPLAKRFTYGVSDEGFFDIRFPAWESTLEMVVDQPVLGTGMGTYGGAIHAYQSPKVPDELHYAHNDYLNLLSDAGVIGFLLGAAFVFAVLGIAVRHLRGPPGQGRTLAIGAMAGAAGVGLHSLFEFNLQIPGVTVPLAIVAGLVLGRMREEEMPAPSRVRWLLMFPVLFIPAYGGTILSFDAAERALGSSRARGSLAAGNLEEARLRAAAVEDELTAGMAAFVQAQQREGSAESAKRHFAAAAERRPLRAEPWFRLGEVAVYESRFEDAYAMFRRARRFSRGMAKPNFSMGVTLMLVGVTKRRPEFVAEGADALREAGTIEPDFYGKAFDAVAPFVKDVETLRRMTPDTTYGHGRLVGLLMKLGRRDEAVEEQRILEEMSPSAAHALTLAGILVRSKRHDEAAAPLGRYLERAGLTERTLEDVYRVYVIGRKRTPALAFFENLTDGRARRIAHAHYQQARLASDLGRYDEALKSIREAIRLDPKDERYRRKQRAIIANRGAE